MHKIAQNTLEIQNNEGPVHLVHPAFKKLTLGELVNLVGGGEHQNAAVLILFSEFFLYFLLLQRTTLLRLVCLGLAGGKGAGRLVRRRQLHLGRDGCQLPD